MYELAINKKDDKFMITKKAFSSLMIFNHSFSIPPPIANARNFWNKREKINNFSRMASKPINTARLELVISYTEKLCIACIKTILKESQNKNHNITTCYELVLILNLSLYYKCKHLM